MRLRDGLLGAVVAVAGFVVLTVTVTELLADAVEFSLLLGLPARLVGGIALGALCYRWLGDGAAGMRRRGAGLAAFGACFLGALVSLVVVGGLRNSQALPVAVTVGNPNRRPDGRPLDPATAGPFSAIATQRLP